MTENVHFAAESKEALSILKMCVCAYIQRNREKKIKYNYLSKFRCAIASINVSNKRL